MSMPRTRGESPNAQVQLPVARLLELITDACAGIEAYSAEDASVPCTADYVELVEAIKPLARALVGPGWVNLEEGIRASDRGIIGQEPCVWVDHQAVSVCRRWQVEQHEVWDRAQEANAERERTRDLGYDINTGRRL